LNFQDEYLRFVTRSFRFYDVQVNVVTGCQYRDVHLCLRYRASAIADVKSVECSAAAPKQKREDTAYDGAGEGPSILVGFALRLG
jgi:hypothetical protein